MGIAKPTIMTAVPRFYQNLFNKINMNFEKQKGIKKKNNRSNVKAWRKKSLKKENLNFVEKIINFLCEQLVRKKLENNLVETFNHLFLAAELWTKILGSF